MYITNIQKYITKMYRMIQVVEIVEVNIKRLENVTFAYIKLVIGRNVIRIRSNNTFGKISVLN